jgi:hypothetical protein
VWRRSFLGRGRLGGSAPLAAPVQGQAPARRFINDEPWPEVQFGRKAAGAGYRLQPRS